MIDIFSYRITKYNPLYRDSNGYYTKNEWTSIADIGKRYDNIELSFETYKSIEDSYICAIELIMQANKVFSLEIICLEEKNLEADPDISTKDTVLFFEKINNGMCLSGNDLVFLIRLILREKIWCKLAYEGAMFIHFGYDYYMYIGSSKELKEERKLIQTNGLFVEDFHSPY